MVRLFMISHWLKSSVLSSVGRYEQSVSTDQNFLLTQTASSPDGALPPNTVFYVTFYSSHPNRVGHITLMAIVCLSVCLSVCPVPGICTFELAYAIGIENQFQAQNHAVSVYFENGHLQNYLSSVVLWSPCHAMMLDA